MPGGFFFRMLSKAIIFLGSFLAFFVQPMVGNTLLPAFGGSAAVWGTCLASFQVMLVAGYFYAHLIRKVVVGRSRAAHFHVALLLLSALGVYIVIGHLQDALPAIVRVIPQPALAAALTVALVAFFPYVVLSSNSTLVQLIAGGEYGLYSVSNFGSLIGLLAYPFLIELKFTIHQQWLLFAILIVVYAIGFAILLARSRAGAVRENQHDEPDAQSRPCKSYLPYFAYSFVSCYLLNAISLHLSSDVSPLPLMWVAELGLFLLSYILAFNDLNEKLYRTVSLAFPFLAVAAVWHYGYRIGSQHFSAEFVLGLSVLFVGCLIVHSRLYRTRPSPAGLSRFYLMIAVGGAAGGAVCSFLMPVVSTTSIEYPLAVAAVFGICCLDLRESKLEGIDRYLRSIKTWHVLAFCAIVAAIGIYRGASADGTILKRYRNFYGIGTVQHQTMAGLHGGSYQINKLYSGGTAHGFQCANGDWKGLAPTAYYADHAGGLAIVSHPKFKARKPMRVAICGMGIGTLASYSRDGDYYRFYEINPAVCKIATDTNLFTFISKALGTVDIVQGDARRALQMEQEADDAKYDVIIVDVFTGDSIPAHMATKEAVALYLDRLEEGGIVSFHLSNWHLDLTPMIKAIGREFNLKTLMLDCEETDYALSATWAHLSKETLPIEIDERKNHLVNLNAARDLPIMTDEYHPLTPYVRLGAFL